MMQVYVGICIVKFDLSSWHRGVSLSNNSIDQVVDFILSFNSSTACHDLVWSMCIRG